MPYTVAVPDLIAERFASWKLSPSVRLALYTQLADRLESDDAGFVREIVAPVRCSILALTIVDPNTNEARDFLFYVNTTENRKHRIILDCTML